MAAHWLFSAGDEAAKSGGLADILLLKDILLQPRERGFFCSDDTIKYPYHETDIIPFEVLVLFLTIPGIALIVAAEAFSDRKLRVANRMYMYGALCTVFVATTLRLACGRLAPNAMEACKLNAGYCANVWQDGKGAGKYVDQFDCSTPTRKREVTQSLPCLYSTLSSYASTFVLVISLHSMERFKPSPSVARPLLAIALTLVPVLISITRYHDYKSHVEDIIAGLLIGAGVAYIWTCELPSKRDSSSIQPQSKDVKQSQRLSEDELMGDILRIVVTSFACLMSYSSSDVNPFTFVAFLFAEVGILLLNFFISLMRRPKAIISRKVSRKSLRVGVSSSAARSNVDGFVTELGSRFGDVVKGVQFIQLPYSKLDDFNIEGVIETQDIDVLALCHSIENRRLTLTDVTDALYANFIPRVSAVLGKARFLVVAHDFKWDVHHADTYSMNERKLRITQPTVYDHAKIILAGKLDGKSSVEVSAACWQEVSQFLKDAAQIS